MNQSTISSLSCSNKDPKKDQQKLPEIKYLLHFYSLVFHTMHLEGNQDFQEEGNQELQKFASPSQLHSLHQSEMMENMSTLF